MATDSDSAAGEDGGRSLTRRRVLGTAAAVAWSAPVVSVIGASPAVASSLDGPPVNAGVKINSWDWSQQPGKVIKGHLTLQVVYPVVGATVIGKVILTRVSTRGKDSASFTWSLTSSQQTLDHTFEGMIVGETYTVSWEIGSLVVTKWRNDSAGVSYEGSWDTNLDSSDKQTATITIQNW